MKLARTIGLNSAVEFLVKLPIPLLVNTKFASWIAEPGGGFLPISSEAEFFSLLFSRFCDV